MPRAGHIYWTNMGIPSLDDGSIERADIDGKNRKTIVSTGKKPTLRRQIILDKEGRQALLVRPRRYARHALAISTASRLETLIESRPAAKADSRESDRDGCVGLDDRPEIRTYLLDAKRP